MRSSGIVALALAAICAASSGSCASPGKPAADIRATAVPAERVFAGRVAGSEALIGLAVDHAGTFSAYVCDGPPGGPVGALTLSTWFSGAVAEESASARAPGAEFEARLRGGTATGTVTVRGRTHTFEAPGATGPANLYRGTDPPRGHGRRGLVVLADGTERGTAYPAYSVCRLPLGAGRPICPRS